MRTCRLRARISAGLLAAGLAGCGGGTGVLDLGGFTLKEGWECGMSDAWRVRGFDYSHFAEAPPGELLAARVRRGDVVALELTNRLSDTCGSSVASVEWRSTSPEVASLARRGPLAAELRASALGETRVSADVTLSDGSRHSALLFAVPSHGSPVLQVHTVRVIR